ncbi:receptor-like kinase LIP1 [Cornus florida]|uniref:receptor-like kinase LIP1 n=1 Tax=Cornus florida TaxID=4283 RepID=UPI0028A17C16|nr:receptor-like kinase LIP1 [Cornus florida]
MDQFRQVGEVLGSLKALMVLKDDISVNQRQCCLLLDMYSLAFETIAEEIRRNLRLEEKNMKWKALEHPMRELYRIFKEGELYIRQCLDIRDWWGKAISLHQNKDCVEFHIHNMYCCFPIVIEAIETAGEISGLDLDDMQRRRQVLMRKYEEEWNDPKLFQWKYGRQYLVHREICSRLETAWREDRWLLLETLREKKSLVPATLAKHEQKLGDLLLKKLNGSEPSNEKLLPSWILVGAKDYFVKRRLGSGASRIKEIQWLGETFALKQFFGEIEPLTNEISLVLSLSHPNIMQYLCGFYDEEKKEGFLIMELMSKNLSTFIKENCGQRKRIPFSLPVMVDVMLQIARGMEYLHSQKIYHGCLNPSNVLIKARNAPVGGYFYAKITGFGLTSIKRYRNSPNQNSDNPVIWYAPEVLAEQEQPGNKCSSMYTEKADVYSFGMLCFELLTGKVPFEEAHLQDDKMSRNIRAGERPLFPYTTPKYLANITRKCWQADPNYRPSFSSVCRILRYIKKCLVINPDHGQPEAPPPLVDFCDIEAGYSKKFPEEGNPDLAAISQIPFQMCAYRLVEKEKTSGRFRDKGWDLANETSSFNGDENGVAMEDPFLAVDERSVCSDFPERRPFSRFREDQRSVCSEAPLGRMLSSKGFDQRSVRSEFPWRKLDQRSVGSETPGRKFDQSSVGSETPWRKFDQMSVGSENSGRKTLSTTAGDPERKMLPTTEADQTSVASEIPRKNSLSTIAADQVSIGSEPEERKTLSTSIVDRTPAISEFPEKGTPSTTANNKKSICSDNPEQATSPISENNQKSVCSECQEKKTSTTTTIACDQKSVCSDISEKKTVSRNKKSVSSENPEKKVVSKKGSNQRSHHSVIPEKKVSLKKKLKDVKASKGPDSPKGHLPRSPSRSTKGHSPKSSSKCSCARCSKMNRENPLPSFMSPIGHVRDHSADSEET